MNAEQRITGLLLEMGISREEIISLLDEYAEDIMQDNDSYKLEVRNLKNAIEEAKTQAHDLWYFLGNA